jgi:predicted phosphodiesterase
MVYGIFTDVHAQITALERVLKRLAKEGATDYLCLGDVVDALQARSFQNMGCLQRMGDFKGALLLGNHDSFVLQESRLPPELLAVLARAALTYESDSGVLLAAHALYTQPREFWDAYSVQDYANELCAVRRFHPGARLLALGHEHTPLLLQWRDSSSVKVLLKGSYVGRQQFTLEASSAYLAIAGPAFRGYGLVYRPDQSELLFFRENV